MIKTLSILALTLVISFGTIKKSDAMVGIVLGPYSLPVAAAVFTGTGFAVIATGGFMHYTLENKHGFFVQFLGVLLLNKKEVPTIEFLELSMADAKKMKLSSIELEEYNENVTDFNVIAEQINSNIMTAISNGELSTKNIDRYADQQWEKSLSGEYSENAINAFFKQRKELINF